MLPLHISSTFTTHSIRKVFIIPKVGLRAGTVKEHLTCFSLNDVIFDWKYLEEWFFGLLIRKWCLHCFYCPGDAYLAWSDVIPFDKPGSPVISVWCGFWREKRFLAEAVFNNARSLTEEEKTTIIEFCCEGLSYRQINLKR